MKKKILITGGCGFIGTNLIKQLLKIKNFEILNLDKISYSSNNVFTKNIKKKYTFLKIDLTEKNKVKKAINEFKPHLIIHLAAETHVDRSIEDPLNFVTNNIISTTNLLIESYEFYKKKITS